MVKQEMQFAVITKGNKVAVIGRSQIIQPQVMYKGNGIKWLDNNKFKKNSTEIKHTETRKDV